MRDDFRGTSGLVEGTAAAFANTWKTSATCPDIPLKFGHPCTLSFNKGTPAFPLMSWSVLQHKFEWKQSTLFNCHSFFFPSAEYANFWCSKLTDASGVFSLCHSVINPEKYKDVGLHTQLYHAHQCLQKCLKKIVDICSYIFVVFTVCHHRIASMTAVPVIKVRNACVLQCLHMYMHVLQQESTFATGDLPSVVS